MSPFDRRLASPYSLIPVSTKAASRPATSTVSKTGGPWWLEASGNEWDTLQSFLVERPGRGSSVTVVLEFDGWTEELASELERLGDFDGTIKIVSINSIHLISPEEFESAVAMLEHR